MIPLYYEIPFAYEKVNNWNNKNTLQKLLSNLNFLLFDGTKESPTQTQREIVRLHNLNQVGRR